MFVAISLDPVHIGSGEYRLGRADNTIVRDPTTNVPKIPGTSIAGVIRAYAEIAKKEDSAKFQSVNIEEIFGTETQQGMVRFYDSQILFFPVTSIQGTVWITTKELIEYWLVDVKDKNGEKLKIPDKVQDKAYVMKGIDDSKPFNLGWLMLELQSISDGKETTLPSKLSKFVKRIVIVSDKLFSHIINDNLEIKTSVRIDPETGTAKEGALFTYEAIPRGTVFGFEVVIDKRRGIVNDADTLIKSTFPYLKLLGVGGLGTRGFGRIEVFPLEGDSGNAEP
ncbi:MAG: type III-B CRISPR module RAMP protein Cmr4 [Candidatus Jordarchaeum sp.]|uniref:type III-B CRISPR module RAMP protein Cmr4 n=1 Tax=Candidatus Jordarchaeum sp. TaxID=2823881 RepID=UPI0040493014